MLVRNLAAPSRKVVTPSLTFSQRLTSHSGVVSSSSFFFCTSVVIGPSPPGGASSTVPLSRIAFAILSI